MFSMRKKHKKVNDNDIVLLRRMLLFLLFLAFITFLEYFITELFLNDSIITIGRQYSIRNLILIAFANCFIVLLCRRMRLATRISLILFLILGLANYFLKIVRGYGLVANDFFAIGTAMNVAGHFHFMIRSNLLIALLLWILGLGSTFFIPAVQKNRTKEDVFVIYGFVFVLLGAIYIYIRISPSFFAGFLDRSWDQSIGMSKKGYLYYNFVNFNDASIKKPISYSVQNVEKILKKYDKTSTQAPAINPKTKTAQNPNIIMIMNESYSDLSVYGNLHTNVPVNPFYKSLKKNTIKGWAYSSVYGGYTSISEYEFLSGNTKMFLPGTPYLQYVKTKLPNLITTIKQQKGYTVADAIHPYNPSGYDRERVYPLLGFDHFYSIKDFKHPEKVRNYISDAESFRKIEQLYENKKPGTSLCVFNVTIQNHSPYDYKNYTFQTPVLSDTIPSIDDANQYLSLAKLSDDALKQLITYFKKQKEPTIIVMFGDHQPLADEEFYKDIYGKASSDFNGKDVMTEHMVPFLIWANYDIPESNNKKISLNYLSGLLLEQAGLQTTPFQDYLMDLQKKLPVICDVGYYDSTGTLHKSSDRKGEYGTLLNQYEMVEYNYLFGGRKRLNKYFTLNQK